MISTEFFSLCGVVLISSVFGVIDPYECCRRVTDCYKICKAGGVLISVEETGMNGCSEEFLVLHDKGISSIAPNAFKNLSITGLKIEFADKELDLSPYSFNGLPNLFSLEFASGIVHLERDLFKAIHYLFKLTLIIDGTKQIFQNTLREIGNLQTLKIHNSNLNETGMFMFYNINPSIYHLELSDNNIVKIREKSFFHFQNLRSLTINEPNLKTLDYDAFDNLDSLSILTIDTNQLSEFSKFLLIDVPELLELKLSGSKIKQIEAETFSDMKLKMLSLDSNNINELEEKSFEGLDELSSLSLDNNNLTIISTNIFNKLRNLTSLSIENNQIHRIENGAFSGLNLLTLSLKNNMLNVINSDVLEGLIVHHLDLTGNNVIKIGNKAMKGCYMLQIDATDDLKIDGDAWGVKKIKLVQREGIETDYMSHTENSSSHSTINDTSYTCCRIIEGAYEVCKENEILLSVKATKKKRRKYRPSYLPFIIYDHESSAIAPNTFKNLTMYNLILDLADEKLSFGADSLNGLPELTSLTFRSGIVPLEKNLFKSLTNLDTLSLIIDGTEDTFQNSLFELKKLKKLEVSHSNLKILEKSTFNNIKPGITELDLVNNSIVTIESEAFTAMKTLESLTIIDKSLQRIDSRAFVGLDKLKHLKIEKANINFLIFQSIEIPSLISLQLTGIFVDGFEADTFTNLKELIVLSLDHNRIKILQNEIIGGLNHLSNLTLSHNEIVYIPKGAFNGARRLRYLFLDNNSIYVIEERAFEGLKLDKLSLMNNKLSHIGSRVFANTDIMELNLDGNDIRTIYIDAFINSKIVSINLPDDEFILDQINGKVQNETEIIFGHIE